MYTYASSRSLVCHLALLLGLFVSIYLVTVPTPAHAATCAKYASGSAIPAGYGASYDLWNLTNASLLNTDCTTSAFSVQVGNGETTTANFAVYKTGYRWTGSTWQAITFVPDGGEYSGNYILGKAKSESTLSYAGTDTYVVAFTCSKRDGAWKCGCRDTGCGQSYWQLQAAVKPVTPGGGNTGGGNTGGGTAAGSLDGMRLVAQHTFSEADLGKELTPKIMFGEYGIFTRTVNPATANYRTIGRAPDGRIAIQENVPRGTVPETTSMSHHFGNGATKAGYAIDVWIPTDFQFPTSCTYPGQGRFPWGLWAGLPTKTSQPTGGGQAISSQDSISFRVNRSGGAGGQEGIMTAYIYNLNRYPSSVCQASNICSGQCSSVSAEGCYGSGGADTRNPSPRGRWFTVEATMSMNNPGKKDGCASLKVDGKQQFARCGYDFGRDKGWLMQGFYGFGMWHCNGSPKDQKLWYSNLRMYSN